MLSVKYINIATKVLLVGLLVHLVLFPDLPQYQNKGMAYRLVLYPFVAFAGYVICGIIRWRMGRHFAYPHLLDLLVTFCITLDMLGNTLNLYDSVVWWDDLMHLANSVPWVLTIGIALRMYTRLSRWNIAALTLGFGAVSHIIWEIGEYLTFVPTNPLEGPSAYRDTIGDLAMSLIGSLIGAILIATVLWQVTERKRSAFGHVKAEDN